MANSPGYGCACPTGFSLGQDNKTCEDSKSFIFQYITLEKLTTENDLKKLKIVAKCI